MFLGSRPWPLEEEEVALDPVGLGPIGTRGSRAQAGPLGADRGPPRSQLPSCPSITGPRAARESCWSGEAWGPGGRGELRATLPPAAMQARSTVFCFPAGDSRKGLGLSLASARPSPAWGAGLGDGLAQRTRARVCLGLGTAGLMLMVVAGTTDRVVLVGV